MTEIIKPSYFSTTPQQPPLQPVLISKVSDFAACL